MHGIYKIDHIALKKRMVEKEIGSIQELADKSQINRNTLSKILSGRARPSSEAMEKLVYTLNIAPEEARRIFFGCLQQPAWGRRSTQY